MHSTIGRATVWRFSSFGLNTTRLNELGGSMTEKETDTGYTDDLLRRVEEIAGNKATGLPENPEALSPEQVQQLLHRLHAHQIRLAMLN